MLALSTKATYIDHNVNRGVYIAMIICAETLDDNLHMFTLACS